MNKYLVEIIHSTYMDGTLLIECEGINGYEAQAKVCAQFHGCEIISWGRKDEITEYLSKYFNEQLPPPNFII